MQKHLFLSALCLSLIACAGPNQTAPSGPLTKEAYTKKFVELYKDYNKTSMKGSNVGAMVFGSGRALPMTNSAGPSAASQSLPGQLVALPSAGGPAPSAPQSVPPSASPSAMPPASPSISPEASAYMDEYYTQQAALMKTIMTGYIKAAAQMSLKLKALTPPAELASQHADLIEYFALTEELGAIMLKELDSKGAKSVFGSGSDAFKAKYKQQMDRIQVLTPKVQDTLYQFQIAAYRQERLALQQGSALDVEAYKTRMRELMPKLPNFMGGGMSGLAGLMPTTSGPPSEAQAKEALAKIKAESQKALDELGRLHPPADLEEQHTLLFATSKLSRTFMLRIMDISLSNLPQLQQGSPNTTAMMMAMFSDEEVISIMMDLSLFMQKSLELSAKLSTLLSPTPQPSV